MARNLQPNIQIVSNAESMAKLVEWLGKKSQEEKPWIAIDTETTGLKPHNSKILLLQMGDTYNQWVIDIAKVHELALFRTVLAYMQLPHIGWVAHNMKFDWGMIYSNWGVDLPKVVCTYIGNELLTKGNKFASSGLGDCVDKYLGIKLDKRQQATFQEMQFGDEFAEKQLLYAGMDTVYLLPLWEKIKELLVQRRLTGVAILEFDALKPIAELEINGLYIDQKLWLNLRDDAEANRVELIKELDAIVLDYVPANLFGDPVLNYNSPAQMKPIFEEIVGQKLDSTDSKYLELFQDEYPVIDIYLKYKKQTKLVTTYGYDFLRKYVDPETGRLYPNFKQLGADTGRMACRDPNLQNIPKQQIYRDPFQAQDPDWRIISADFSNQEIRLLVQISQEPALIQAMKEKKDIHSFSASMLFGIPYEDFLVYDDKGNQLFDAEGEALIKKDMKSKYRNPAKSITFG